MFFPEDGVRFCAPLHAERSIAPFLNCGAWRKPTCGSRFRNFRPQERRRLIDGVFASVARLLADFARFPEINASNVHDVIRYEGLEHYQRAKQKGRGILVATAHLGNWELSAFTHALMTEPMYVMVRPLDNPLIDRLVEERRQLSGNKLILKKDAALSVVRALKANQAVGILIDQNTTPEEGVFIDFFGVQACAGAGISRNWRRERARP